MTDVESESTERSASAPAAPSWAPRGLLVPFQRDQKSDFANGTGEVLLRSQVQTLLMTRAASEDGSAYGELEWDQEAGSQLYRVRHLRLNDPGLVELFRYRVAEPVAAQLRRVRITKLRVELDRNQRASRVKIGLQPTDARGTSLGDPIALEVPIAGEST